MGIISRGDFRKGFVDRIVRSQNLIGVVKLCAEAMSVAYSKGDFDLAIRFKDAHNNAANKLERISMIDELTRVSNRRGFDKYANEMVLNNKRTGIKYGLMLVDVDSFKSINDIYGHLAGDRVIAETARNINNCLRSNSFVGRYGGDEFIVALPDTGIAGTLAAGYNLNKVIAGSKIDFVDKNRKRHDRPVTISVGVSEFNGSRCVDDVIAEADVALYGSKEAGRNCVSGPDGCYCSE